MAEENTQQLNVVDAEAEPKAIIMDNKESDAFVSEITSTAPVRATCPNCAFNGMTTVSLKRSGCGTFSCIIMIFCLLCCVPMCMRSCYNAVHTCQSCKQILGKV